MRASVFVFCLAAGAVIFAVACRGEPPRLSHGAATPSLSLKNARKLHGTPVSQPLAREAVAGVSDPELRTLLADHWEWTLRQSPRWATTLGDHRGDERLEDPSHRQVVATRKKRAQLLLRAEGMGVDGLSPRDALTARLLTEQLKAEAAREVCQDHLWEASVYTNPVSDLNYLPKQHPPTDPARGASLLKRYQGVAGVVDAHIANLRQGASSGLFASAQSLLRAVKLIDKQLATAADQWALAEPLKGKPEAWKKEDWQRFSRALLNVLEQKIVPAYARYRDVLKTELIPHARGEQSEGLVGMGRGPRCYQARIADFTGTGSTAEQLHQLGQQEVTRINEEMRKLGKTLLGTSKLPDIFQRLRTDSSLFFTSRQEVLAKARESLASARQMMPQFFGILPKADCVVAEIPSYEAPFSTIAYYRQPHYDGSKPGEFFVNTYKPMSRPRFEAQVLAFHEAIPGHHLQIAIAQERSQLPAFRKFGGNTSFVEGWALYTEQLADEMGLYSGPLDRMGMYSYDAWRASRLVVDTGLHALGWTRKRAEKFLMEHTALAANNVSNEVDRYIAWPGQALAYKVGQLEILKLRELARKKLGAAFDIRGFHDVVLQSGALRPEVLREQLRMWLSQQ